MTTPAPAVHATVYAVDVHERTPHRSSTTDDLERFTPLPAATFPKVMFMGATDGGRDAVFALGTGVSARGPGVCRPSRADCASVLLPAGRTERFDYYVDYSKQRTLQIAVPRIRSRVIDSATELKAAGMRYSRVGACELQIGDPLLQQSYDAAGSVAFGSACTRKMNVAAFPGPASGSGL